MIAACPQCGARYRIEPERLPAQGARLRCSRCEAIFRVNAPRAEPAPEPPRDPQPTPAAGPREQGGAAAAQRGAAERSAGPREQGGAAAAQRGAAERSAGPRSDSARPRVLVADPDIEAGKGLAGMLAGWGVEPVLVHDGVEAILTIQRLLPSLVVLEASLPKMFGFQVCELMKRNEQLRSIPVVLVGSIHHRERYRRQAAETYGADAYIEQPALADSLLAMLRQRGILAEQAAPPPEPPPPVREPRVAPARPAPAAPVPGPDPELAADLARAERLARIIVSDIVLYNPERFEAAIRSGDVVLAMAAEMEEGRAHFRERIAESIRERKDFLGEELRRVARLRGAK